MTEQEILELGKKRAAELGLCVALELPTDRFVIRDAMALLRLLGAGVESTLTISDMQAPNHQIVMDTFYRKSHTALLIGIKPIKVETREEKLEAELRRLVEAWWPHKELERAKKLLEGK